LTKKIAAALAGDAKEHARRKFAKSKKADDDLIRDLTRRLAQGGQDADRIRTVLTVSSIQEAGE